MKKLLFFSSLLLTLHCARNVHAQTGPAGVNSGIVLWLDGSNVNNTTTPTNPTNGTAISTWKDVSGNGNDATVLAGQNTPTISTAQMNGHDVINFTRTSNVLGTVYEVAGVDIRSTSLPQITILTVYRQGTNVVTDWQGVWGNDNGNWDRFFMPRFASDNGIVSVGPTTNYVSVTDAGTVGTTKLLTAVYDHGVTNGSTIYFNGLPVQSVTDNTDPTAAQATLRLGWDGDDNPLNGDIAEVVVYDRKLTDCEIQAINRYFGLKFGVTITTASISPAPKSYFCPSANTTLTSSTGLTYQWLLNGTPISTATSATYSASGYGKYQVVVGNGVCLDTSAATTVYEAGPVLYVDSSALSSGSGLSWSSPLKTVSAALDIANNTSCNVQIWVKKGTYYPMSDTVVATNRDSSLRILRNNIKLYGGFAGTETAISQRNISTNVTILSGDIGIAGDNTDNSYHVMTLVGASGNNIDTPTVVDGFTIRDGKAETTGTITVNGVTVYRGAGGGINTAGAGTGSKSSPLLENLIFINNAAVWGGGLYGEGHGSGISDPFVRNCTFINNEASAQGGGVHFYTDGTGGSASPVFISCTFTNNHGVSQGGAGFLNGGTPGVSNAQFTSCTFDGNHTDAVNSGSVYGGGLVFFGATSTPTVRKSTFTNNASSYGGGICSAGPLQNLTADSNTFTGNSAINSGGGIVFQNAGIVVTHSSFTANKANTGGGIGVLGTASLAVSDCNFTNDSAAFYGAAVYNANSAANTYNNVKFINNYGAVVGAVDKPGAGTATFTKCVFSGNKAGELGGVMNNNNGTSNFINCLLENNSTTTTANAGGGTVHVQGGTTVNFYNSTLSNNTTASTTVPGSNALSVDATGTLSLTNTIVWGGATTQIDGAGTPTLNNSLVRGATVIAPNLNINPQFVNAADADGTDNIWGTTDDGLNLTACSPAINAGDNTLVQGTLTSDFTGGTRVQNTTLDMGAYETSNNYNIPFITGSSSTDPTNCGLSDGTISLTGLLAATNYNVNYSFGGTPQTAVPVTADAGGVVKLTGLAVGTYTDISVTLASLGCVSLNSIAGPINISALVQPSVATQPLPSHICEAGNTTFAVSGAGSNLGYQWQVNNGTGFVNITNGGVYSNATTNTLNITGATTAMAGYFFRAIVSGTCSPSDTSDSVALAIDTLPVVKTHPVNTPACLGTNTSFTTVAAGTNITYQWQLNTGGGYADLTNAAPYSNVTTPTLNVASVTAGMNNYSYRVIVTGTCAPPDTSNDAVLSIYNAPVVTGDPTPVLICEASNTSFSATATGSVLAYQWQVDNGSGFVNLANSAPYSNVTTATLNITNTPVGLNNYQYRVVVSGACTPNDTSAAATLSVNGLPKITTQPTNTGVCVTDNTTITVTAVGTAITYQWQVNTGSGFSNVANTGVYSGATTSALTITGAPLSMSGYTYRVVISGTCTPPATSNVVTLTVNVPPTITGHPGSITTCEKDKSIFSVVAFGSGLTYQWEVNTGSGYTALTNVAPYSGVNSSTLTITNTPSGFHKYKYRVIVGGLCPPSVTSNEATLVVNLLPKITSQSTNTSVCPGSPIVFSTTTVGGTGYQWEMNTGAGFGPVPNTSMYSGTTSPVLTIVSPTIGMTGYEYRLRVVGICPPDAISGVMKLNVYQISITSQMTSDTACEGWMTQIGVRASGGGLYYQWQRKTSTGYVDVVNAPPYSGANTDSLRITEVPGTLSGSIYRCKVLETALCSLTFYSADIPLYVNQAPATNPDKLTVNVSGSATFSVPNTATSFQWQEDRNDGAGFSDLVDNNPYSGVNTNTLTVNPVTLDMSQFKYRCVVKGLCFTPMSSKPATLTVEPALTIKTTSIGDNNVVIYPNPLSGAELNISFDKPVKGNTSIIVMDKLGQLIYTANIDFSKNTKGTISLPGIAAGVYTIHFVNETAHLNTVSRFTKQ